MYKIFKKNYSCNAFRAVRNIGFYGTGTTNSHEQLTNFLERAAISLTLPPNIPSRLLLILRCLIETSAARFRGLRPFFTYIHYCKGKNL
jgi:hypothetical protein